MRMRTILLLALIASATLGYSSDQLGRITGIVLDENGQPMDRALVCSSAAGTSQSECRTFTDRTGQFEIQNVPMGATIVFASKDEDGYSPMNQTHTQQTVTLTAQDPVANVTIKLAPRAGTLIGTVRDSVTGKPIGKHVNVTWMQTDGASSGSSGTSGQLGTFRVNLPTKDLLVFVSAPGYKTWFYRDPSDQVELHLASGEQKSVDIELVPKQ